MPCASPFNSAAANDRLLIVDVETEDLTVDRSDLWWLRSVKIALQITRETAWRWDPIRSPGRRGYARIPNRRVTGRGWILRLELPMETADASLRIELLPKPGAAFSGQRIPLLVRFSNVGAAPIRLLRCFEPVPVFFAFQIVGADGTPVGVPGAGKIDFGPNGPAYLALAAGEEYRHEIDPGRLLSAPLPPGTYRIAATYHNQYGERCFTGRLISNSITVQTAD